MKKTNNKGFSLVELIVVVLIMGILAVALTPQVLKWVNNSRKATDIAAGDTIVSALQTALTNETAHGVVTGTAGADCYVLVSSAGITAYSATNKTIGYQSGTITPGTTTAIEALAIKFSEYAGIAANTDIKTKSSKGVIKVTINSQTGQVTAIVGTTSDGAISHTTTDASITKYDLSNE